MSLCHTEGTDVVSAPATAVARGIECGIPIESPFQSGGMAVSSQTLSSMAHGMRFRCSWIGETFPVSVRASHTRFTVRHDAISDTGKKHSAFVYYVNDNIHILL